MVKKAWAIIGILVILILLLEGGLYLALALRESLMRPSVESVEDTGMDERVKADGYQVADWTKELFREFDESNVTEWHSYVYWRRALYKGRYINIDEKGLRRTWNPSFDEEQAGSKVMKVFFFGGSAAWGTGARDDHTIPSCLSRILNEGGMRVKVTNFGESGYVSTQGLITLILELRRGNVPDLAIFYDGVNDTFSAYQNRMAGIPQNEENRIKEFNALRDGGHFDLELAALLKKTSIYRFSEGLGRRLAGGPESSFDLDAGPGAEGSRLADELVSRYRGNLELIRILGKLRDFTTLFYWQPAVSLKAHLTPYEAMMAEKDSKYGEWYTEACRRIAALESSRAEEGFHDLSGIFKDVKEPIFIDWSHVTEQGNTLIARRIAKNVEELFRE
jgi:lysophospholipase L1-like esterase